MRKKIFLVTILLVCLVLTISTNTSFAEGPADELPVKGEMVLECDKMNGKVLEYAQSQG